MTRFTSGSPRWRCGGFTLIEISVALIIIGLLIGAIAIPLATRIESSKIENTSQALDLVEEKLLAYATRFGYFPCPADAASNGLEPAGTNHTTGSCPTWYGFLPAAAMGWTPVDAQGYALDSWAAPGAAANRIRYAVSNQTVGGVANPFTAVNGMGTAGIAALMSNSLLRVCGSGSGVNAGVDCGTAQTLAFNAAVVIWSVGPNAVTGGTSVDEAQNPNPNGGSADVIFVSRDRSGGTGAEYDDIVRWIPITLLIGRLRAAGVL